MKKILLLSALLFLPLMTKAYDAKINGIYYNFNTTAQTATVTYLNKNYPNNSTAYSGEVWIPSEVYYNGVEYSVTSIDEYAFWDCEGLTSVTIPNSVTSIGKAAFSFCTSLNSITLPNSVTAIGERAFWNCTSLTSITIPNSVTNIGREAFSDCI